MLIEGAVQADAEKAVDDERKFLPQQFLQLRQIRFRRGDIQDFRFSVFDLFMGSAGIVAVVAFAGQDQDGIARAGEPACAFGHALSDAADHLRLRLAGGPRGLFPFPHLRDRDDR